MLRPRKKIHRKEIKEDALVTNYFRVRKLVDRYSRQINIGLIALLAIAVVEVSILSLPPVDFTRIGIKNYTPFFI